MLQERLLLTRSELRQWALLVIEHQRACSIGAGAAM